MKRWFYVLLGLLLILILGAWYVYPRLPIITGYAAKMTCSCYFVADRDLESIKQEDLNFSLVSKATVSVNEEDQSASATVSGLARQTAVYRPGLGCTLIPEGYDRENLAGPASLDQATLPARPDTLAWPMGQQLADTLPPGIQREALVYALKQHFDQGEEADKNTRAILVVYKDQLVAEQYAPGFDAETPILGWSMTKSITNALVGIRHSQGYLALHEPLDLPDWQDDGRNQITLHHLMQMSSGLEWEEVYSDIADATKMLYQEPDFAEYAAQSLMGSAPDSVWSYSSGTTNLISGILRESFTDDADYWRFPRRALFNRIGMRTAVLEPDFSGTYVGSSYCFASPRDWARFGLLYLHDGIWMGERILPEGWVDYSTQPARQSEGQYGAQIWLNQSGEMPDAPRDMFSFNGFQGQRVFVLPGHDLVIVRMGLSADGTFDFNAMVRDILAEIPAIQ